MSGSCSDRKTRWGLGFDTRFLPPRFTSLPVALSSDRGRSEVSVLLIAQVHGLCCVPGAPLRGGCSLVPGADGKLKAASDLVSGSQSWCGSEAGSKPGLESLGSCTASQQKGTFALQSTLLRKSVTPRCFSKTSWAQPLLTVQMQKQSLTSFQNSWCKDLC